MKLKRERWTSKAGIILAVAGSAVGLGNFLRFPTQAVQNGGGAFMIPYFISFLLLGIPLIWVEWAVGRYGGLFGHGSAPLIFDRLWKNRAMKYFGAIGVFGPLVIVIYYTYIESWLLGYAFHSATGALTSIESQEGMLDFLRSYQGLGKPGMFRYTYLFFLITFVLNFAVIYRGIKGGIEKLCKIAMPLLFLLAIILMVRVLTLGSPDPAQSGNSISQGLGFLWNPDFSALKDAKVWIAAAGQMFFTLSVGIGVILTYASYLSHGDDIVLSGLTASSLNEVAEVILGGSIVIPAAVMFLGIAGAQTVAASGSFNIGFVTMPFVLGKIPWGAFFSFVWFALLFLAGLTSSISLLQPAVSFLSDELHVSRKKATLILAGITFTLCQAPIFFLANGVMDELDFWAGTFFLVVFATLEVIIFVWAFGIEKAWEQIHHGAELHVPRFYKFIIKYVTPLFLFFILGFWLWQYGISTFFLKGVPKENIPYVLATRIGLLVLFVALAWLVRHAYRRRYASDS
jgi:SNF family Na+-dependent transporter